MARKKSKYDEKFKTDLSFDEILKKMVSVPKEAVNKGVKSSPKKKPKPN